MNTTTAYASTDMNQVVMTLIPVDTFVETQRRIADEREYNIFECPLIGKFEEVLRKTSDDIFDIYQQDAQTEYGKECAKRHHKLIIEKFIKDFNQVGDIHRIIAYAKMKSKKHGRQRIDYARSKRLPEYDERLLSVCLIFLRNYYGDVKAMKMLLTS